MFHGLIVINCEIKSTQNLIQYIHYSHNDTDSDCLSDLYKRWMTRLELWQTKDGTLIFQAKALH